MGAYNNTYFGVYLRINNTQKTVTEMFHVDSNGKRQETKFNSETGEKYEVVTKKVSKTIRFNHYDVLVDFEDSFFSPEYIQGKGRSSKGYTTLLSNVDDDLFATTIEDCKTFDLPIGFSIDKAIEAFEEYYMPELTILRNKNVEFSLHCGVVNYAN